MYIAVDAGALPATMALCEPADFKAFKAVVRVPAHVYVPIDELLALAGDQAADAQWRRGFDAMVAYADEHGWLRDGAIRAHVELQRED